MNGTGKHNVNKKKMKTGVMEMRVYRGVTGDRVYAIIATVREPNYPNNIQVGLVQVICSTF